MVASNKRRTMTLTLPDTPAVRASLHYLVSTAIPDEIDGAEDHYHNPEVRRLAWQDIIAAIERAIGETDYP